MTPPHERRHVARARPARAQQGHGARPRRGIQPRRPRAGPDVRLSCGQRSSGHATVLLCSEQSRLRVERPGSSSSLPWAPSPRSAALITLAVLRLVPLPKGVVTWWALRPRGWRRLLTGGGATLAVLITVYALSASLTGALGLAQTQVWAVLLPALPSSCQCTMTCARARSTRQGR